MREDALLHKPIVPPRAGHIEEGVYASMWEELMTATDGDEYLNADERPIARVLRHYNKEPANREAAILATMACWLGTNVGMAMMANAHRLSAATPLLRDSAFLVSWTLENRRRLSVNHGARLSEYLLATAEQRAPNDSMMGPGLTRLPQLTADDLEVIDHFMLWLGTPEGARFFARCEDRIRDLREERRKRQAEELARHNGAATEVAGHA